MAICPECLSEKPFWANRCHACNTWIGFVYQLFAQWVYLGTIFYLGAFIVVSLGRASWELQWIVYWLAHIILPFAIVWLLAKIRQLIFG